MSKQLDLAVEEGTIQPAQTAVENIHTSATILIQ